MKQHLYRLTGQIYVIQRCHIAYPESTELPMLKRCTYREDCEGHEIRIEHSEECWGRSPDDAWGNWSLSKYEAEIVEIA